MTPTLERRSESRQRYNSGARQTSDHYSRRYNYRSRSDVANELSGRHRYHSQTLLEGARPGPTTPTWRRDALETLQRELTARSPRDPNRGYSSDTGYLNDTWRSRRSGGRGYENFDYGNYGRYLSPTDAYRQQYFVTRVASSLSTDTDNPRIVNLK